MIPREEIISMARKANASFETAESMFKFTALVEARAATAEREACAKTRNTKPRQLPRVGSGALLDEQQYCYEKGWKEGVAAFRKAIRARGEA